MNRTISDKERELIIARLEVLSPELRFSSGNDTETYSRDQIIEHVKEGDAVGNAYVKIELDFLRALKDGTLINQLAQV